MFILEILTTIIVVAIVGVITHRICTYVRWYCLLRDYEKLSNRLDNDIKLLRDKEFCKAVLREAESDRMVKEYYRKYPG